jgi:hypothetical protein
MGAGHTRHPSTSPVERSGVRALIAVAVAKAQRTLGSACRGVLFDETRLRIDGSSSWTGSEGRVFAVGLLMSRVCDHSPVGLVCWSMTSCQAW